MRRVSQIVQQDFHSTDRKRLPDEPHEPDVVVEKLGRVVGNLFAVVLLKELRVNFLFGWLELIAHIILLPDEDQLPRRRAVFILEEIMHPKPKILQTELAEILAGDDEWIEIVLFQVSAKLAALFLVLTPKKACCQKEHRHNDRRDDVDTEFALQSFDHRTNIFPAAFATGLRPMPVRSAVPGKTAHRAVATTYCWRQG